MTWHLKKCGTEILGALRSAKKCGTGIKVPDFLMPGNECTVGLYARYVTGVHRTCTLRVQLFTIGTTSGFRVYEKRAAVAALLVRCSGGARLADVDSSEHRAPSLPVCTVEL